MRVIKMSNFTLSARSITNLNGVDPSLVKVVQRAIQITSIDFMVVQGMRSREECMINWGKGRSVAECAKFGIPANYSKPALNKVTWLANPFNSKHAQGKAVDLAPLVNGTIDWGNIPNFLKIADAMKQASKELNVAITYGGDWTKSKDYPHFEV